MSTTLTTRIPDELYAEIERISQAEHLDKSAVTRRLLESAVQEHKLDAAIASYEQGSLTLRGVAAHAGRTLREVLSELASREIPSSYGVEDLEEDLAGLTDA